MMMGLCILIVCMLTAEVNFEQYYLFKYALFLVGSKLFHELVNVTKVNLI